MSSKRIFILAFCFLNFSYSVEKIDINNSNLNQLFSIPINEEKIILVYDYIQMYGSLKSIYDILYIPEIESTDLEIFKKYVIILNDKKIKPYLKFNNQINYQDDLSEKKYNSLIIEDNYKYKALRLLSDNGTPEESISEYLVDHYYNPSNINKMTYQELISIRNVSPMDALAVLKQRSRGEIKGQFHLKNSPGISYYGYKNLLDYVSYEDKSNSKSYIFRIGVLSTDYKIQTDLEDATESADNIINPNFSIPYSVTKFSLSKNILSPQGINFLNDNITLKISFLRQNNMGDPKSIYNDKSSISFENIIDGENIKLNKLIIGNFTASFGQGVIFDSKDSYNRNRTGYKFDKRMQGIYPDLTTIQQYTLKGFATEFTVRNQLKLSVFYSHDKRDAVINSDGSFSSMIILSNRLGLGYSGNENKIFENMINALDERTIGVNVTFSSKSNKTRFGMTIYESLYDRILSPQFIETIIGGPDPDYQGDPKFLNYYSNSADPEISALYSNSATSSRWDEVKSRRLISGLEFNHIIDNMCFQVEYGELSHSNSSLTLFDGDPNAYVLSSFMKFDTFDFIILYRDYDLEYDNPYQRSFSEYQFGKTTILEDSYWLEDPIFENLYSNNPKPQAEKGIYVESRYQFHKTLIGSFEYDIWTRKADEARYFNIVTKLDWNPLFNYRIKFRYKWKGRGQDNQFHPSPFYSNEARIKFQLRLSNFDSMELLYNWSNVSFNPKPRLVYDSNPFIYEMQVGNIGNPDHSLGVSISHNFDNNINMKVGFLYAGGFMWYIEDDTFVLLEDQTRTWVSFNFVPQQTMAVKFLFSYAVKNPTTTVYSGQTDFGNYIDNPYSFNERLSYKIQIDYVL